MTVLSYYYGCLSKEDLGHFLYDIHLRRVLRKPDTGFPCCLTPDGVFLEEGRPLYKPRFWRSAGWTVYAMWDSSADKRPGSSSTFIFREDIKDMECWDAVVRYFPSIAKRIDDARSLVSE